VQKKYPSFFGHIAVFAVANDIPSGFLLTITTVLGFNLVIGQRPRGNENQLLTDTALFGHIAARLEGVVEDDLPGWAAKLGIDVGANALRKSPNHATRIGASAGRSVLRKSLAIDWASLNFFSATARLRLHGSDDFQRLAAVPGVVDLYLLEGALALLIVVYERLNDQRALESGLRAFGELESWERIESYRHDALQRTSREFARRAAEREGLLRSPG
jgi:hypothetical protein